MTIRLAPLWLGPIGLGTTSVALAHGDGHAVSQSPWTWWGGDPWSLLPVVIAGWLYIRGLRRLWSGAGPGRGVRRWQAAAFGAGWLSLALALLSPLDPLGGALFAVHMIQHEVLMVVAAPLLVLGAPLVTVLWAMPQPWRRSIGRETRRRWLQIVWRILAHPFVAWALYAIVLWSWHLPGPFEAALGSELVHALEHASFLAVALLLWWTAFRSARHHLGYGIGVVSLFTTAVHSSILGALLTFAPKPWYPAYGNTTAVWGLTPLEDQQLGGLIMWVPGGIVYVVAVLAFAALWLDQSESRAQRRKGQPWVEQR